MSLAIDLLVPHLGPKGSLCFDALWKIRKSHCASLLYVLIVTKRKAAHILAQYV